MLKEDYMIGPSTMKVNTANGWSSSARLYSAWCYLFLLRIVKWYICAVARVAIMFEGAFGYYRMLPGKGGRYDRTQGGMVGCPMCRTNGVW